MCDEPPKLENVVRSRSSLAKKIVLMCIVTTAALGCTEAYLRLRTPRPLHGFLPATPGFGDMLELDSLLQYRFKPGLKNVHLKGMTLTGPVAFTVNINQIGLRGREIRPEHDRFRILVIGDSCTFGLGVDDDQTYPARLERYLNDADPSGRGFEVINAGVPGYTAMYGARYLAARGIALEPDLVIACFGNNGANFTSDPAGVDRRAFTHWTGGAIEDVLLGLRLYAVAKRRFIAWHGRREGSGSPPVSENELNPLWPRLTEDEYRTELVKISDTCSRAEVPLVFMAWPWTFQVGYPLKERKDSLYRTGFARRILRFQDVTAQVSKERGRVFVDLRSAFRQAAGKRLYFDLAHATEEGLDVVARMLCGTVRDRFATSRVPVKR